MRKYLLISGLSVLVLLPGCLSTNLFVDINQLQTDLVDIGPITPEAFPEDDAVTLLNETTVNVSLVTGARFTRPETEVTYHTVRKIFRNLSAYSSISLQLDNDDILKSVGARVINPDGTIVVVQDADIVKVSYEAGVGMDKEKGNSIKITFPGLRENSMIEYFYVVNNSAFFSTARWDIQEYEPVLKKRL